MLMKQFHHLIEIIISLKKEISALNHDFKKTDKSSFDLGHPGI